MKAPPPPALLVQRAGALLLLLVLFSVGCCALDSAPAKKRLIVEYSDGTRAASGGWAAALAPHGVAVVRNSGADRFAILEGEPEAVDAAAAGLPGITLVEEDHPVWIHVSRATQLN